MASGERRRELRKRRIRKRKLAYWKKRVGNASPSEKAVIAEKIRKTTPGANVIINDWGLEER